VTIITIRKEACDYIVSVSGELFREAIETLKDRISSYHRKYSPSRRCWIITSRNYLDDFIAEIEDWSGLRVEWFGARESRWQPPPRPGRLTRADAFTALHLLPTAPPELVKAAHKVLALKFHPDRPGGDLRTMQAVNAAFDLLVKETA
jgi:hypothetical protein